MPKPKFSPEQYKLRLHAAFLDGLRNAAPAAERKKQLRQAQQRRKWKR